MTEAATRRAASVVRQMRTSLAYYDFLLPGDFVPDPPWRKRWFRWGPAFVVTDELVQWAGALARARTLMDLDAAASAIMSAVGDSRDAQSTAASSASGGVL